MLSRILFWKYITPVALLEIIGSDSYTGKSFLVSAMYNGNLVNALWSITQGSQYASINEYGKVTIEEGVEGQTIIIRATYNNMVAEAMATISYDNQLVISSADTIL